MKVQSVSSALIKELNRVVVGQPELSYMLTVCMLAGGHALIEGAPGLGKTLAARTLAKASGVPFKRVQFTPDLMPSDIVGTSVFDAASGQFVLRKGPIFTSFLLADEINRTPPKTQSALLEAMEENRVTIDGVSHSLDQPFMVFATQNSIEYEGTYPLPEAQLDRFMMKLIVGYPPRQEAHRLLQNVQHGFDAQTIAEVETVASATDILDARAEVKTVRVEDSLLGYVLDMLDVTRADHNIQLGASPRAGIALLTAGKVVALMNGRDFCVPEDFRQVAGQILRHRIILTPDAEIEGITPDHALELALSRVPVPR